MSKGEESLRAILSVIFIMAGCLAVIVSLLTAFDPRLTLVSRWYILLPYAAALILYVAYALMDSI